MLLYFKYEFDLYNKIVYLLIDELFLGILNVIMVRVYVFKLYELVRILENDK